MLRLPAIKGSLGTFSIQMGARLIGQRCISFTREFSMGIFDNRNHFLDGLAPLQFQRPHPISGGAITCV